MRPDFSRHLLIDSSDFRDARKGLGIAKHWFLIIPGSPPVGPSWDELLDALYYQLAVEEECGIVEFGKLHCQN